MNSALVCASHSPLLYCYDKAPADWDAICEGFARAKAFVDEFAPDLVIVFGADHFNGFFLNLMPAFCVGLAAEATGDIGGFSGRLDVPADTAMDCINHLRRHDIDAAVSYQMTIDHAFSQTLHKIVGGVASCPTIPVFINAITRPFVPFRRTRLLGEQIGKFASMTGKKVLFLASGGMSHHPTRYYPAYGSGDQGVTAWQLSGGKLPDSLTHPQWLERLESMHHEGAAMITRGERTAADMRLNASSDQRFLDVLLSGDLQQFDQWDPDTLVAEGGIGSMELQTWIAATSAHLACAGGKPQLDVYSVAPEIGIACGIVHA